jgi:hypothetical protein
MKATHVNAGDDGRRVRGYRHPGVHPRATKSGRRDGCLFGDSSASPEGSYGRQGLRARVNFKGLGEEI